MRFGRPSLSRWQSFRFRIIKTMVGECIKSQQSLWLLDVVVQFGDLANTLIPEYDGCTVHIRGSCAIAQLGEAGDGPLPHIYNKLTLLTSGSSRSTAYDQRQGAP